MARYEERSPQWIDIIEPFEARSHQEHAHDALACIGRLKDEGRRFWSEGSPQLGRWEAGCTELWGFINNLGARKSLEKQDLTTAMREFIQAFEHNTGRMYQMVYGAVDNPDDDQGITDIFEWFNLTFRFSVYALLSGWIDDKQEENVAKIEINLVTGEVHEREWERTEMKVPRKYRRAARRI